MGIFYNKKIINLQQPSHCSTLSQLGSYILDIKTPYRVNGKTPVRKILGAVVFCVLPNGQISYDVVTNAVSGYLFFGCRAN
jgi:hypothetical protein